MKTLIFTDLDGTLLDHETYSYEKASKALDFIKTHNIPLIFTTSKTKDETLKLQKKMNIKEPMIVENGAALFIPKDYQNLNLQFLQEYDLEYRVFRLGKKYKQILEFYTKYKDEFGMLGFSDMDIEQVVNYTGLKSDDAKLAKNRDFTEPFILKDETKLVNLKNLAKTYNIKITKGGRFYHLIGKDQDKGLAVKKAINIFQTLFDDKINSIALGDGQNDISMLKVVDIPINIKNHKGEYLDINLDNLQRSSFKSTLGFNEMVLKNVK